MINCSACRKVYSTPHTLKKHWERQPLCEEWIGLKRELVKDFYNYVDPKIHTTTATVMTNTTCMACKTAFASAGTLNKHLESSEACSKWDLYNDLGPIQGYAGDVYSAFEQQSNSAASSMKHIIWNVFLTDKESAKSKACDMGRIMAENNIKYVIAILPHDVKDDSKDDDKEWLAELGVDYQVVAYSGHDMNTDLAGFDAQCAIIEEYRARRENVAIFCNNGYQRSLPFLTYYLTAHHRNEVPDIERAVDIILPQVDKFNYAKVRDGVISDMKRILLLVSSA